MPRPEALELGVETLAGVGPALRRKLGRLGIATIGDLLAHRPRRYESAAEERTVASLFGDDEAVLEVVVRRVSGRRRGRLHILTAHVADGTGEIRATWFNQPWLETRLTPGTRLRLRGKPNRFGFQVSSYDIGDAAQTADFAPVYPATADLAQKTLRGLTDQALVHARAGGEPLPASVSASAPLPAPRRRARRAAPAALRGRRRARSAPARARRAPRPPARAEAARRRARDARRGAAASAR